MFDPNYKLFFKWVSFHKHAGIIINSLFNSCGHTLVYSLKCSLCLYRNLTTYVSIIYYTCNYIEFHYRLKGNIMRLVLYFSIKHMLITVVHILVMLLTLQEVVNSSIRYILEVSILCIIIT